MKKLLTIVLTIFFVSSLTAQSLKLATNGSCVNAGDLDISGNQITVEATILMTDLNSVNIISKHYWEGDVNFLLRPFAFQITTSTQYYFLEVPYRYELNKWYHIAATYDGSIMKYYINGCLITQMVASGNLIQNNHPVTIGNSIVRINLQSEQFYGNIDEVRIWNVAHTQSEIQANAINLPNPTTQTGLKLYYKFANNYINLQGTAAFNGTAVGSPSFNAAEMTILPPIRPNTEGLVAYYPFTGNAQDASGNNNHGTTFNVALTTDRFGEANRAYRFNGNDSRIEITDNPSLRVPLITMCAWVRPDPNNSVVAILNKRSLENSLQEQYFIGINERNNFWSAIKQNSNCVAGVGWLHNYAPNNSFVANNWQQIVSTFDGATLKIYVNGLLISSETATSTKIDSCVGGNLRIGYVATIFPAAFKGDIDDVRIYNRAMTECEVKGLYESEKPPIFACVSRLDSGLVAYYPFTGNVRDSSRNNNHGTVYGATLTTDRFGVANRAYGFNGINNYIEVKNNAALQNDTNDFTISAWIKTTNPNRGRIVSKGSGFCQTGYAMRTVEGANAGINLSAADGNCIIYLQNPKPVNNGVWHHVTGIVKRNQFAAIYIDGILDKIELVNSASNRLSNNLNVLIGYSGYSAGTEFFNGNIDDIRMYNRALTECEVKDLYEQERTPITQLPDLLAWYPFSGNGKDTSGNNFHSTIKGATFTADRFGNPNSALEFDGINDVVTVLDNDTLDIGLRDYTLVSWIKTNSSNWGRIISKGSSDCVTGYMMRTGGTNASSIHLENAFQDLCRVNYFGNKIVNDNRWHCVVGTVKRDSFAKIYVDGSFDKRIDINTNTYNLSNNLNLLIGANHNTTKPEWFKGSLDEVRLYGKVLNLQEIAALCESKPTQTEHIEINDLTIQVYPNPANSMLTISCSNTEGGIQSVDIYNTMGQLVVKYTFANNSSIQTLDISGLLKGTYFVKGVTSKGIGLRKFIKI